MAAQMNRRDPRSRFQKSHPPFAMGPSFRVPPQIQGDARRVSRAPSRGRSSAGVLANRLFGCRLSAGLGWVLGLFGRWLWTRDDPGDVGILIGATNRSVRTLPIADVAAFGLFLLPVLPGQLFLAFLEWICAWSHIRSPIVPERRKNSILTNTI